jgi:hypothetical protein
MAKPIWLQILIEKRQAYRIATARLHLRRLLVETPRPWFAARTGGGGVVTLGRVTRANAVAQAKGFGTVIYVDTDAAFIAYSDSKSPEAQ